jgi:hypothetical protein
MRRSDQPFFFLATFFLAGLALEFVLVAAFLAPKTESQFCENFLLGAERTIGPDIKWLSPEKVRNYGCSGGTF